MFDLSFLGTSASTPSAERGLPALMVSCGGHRVLIDCGEGTQRQILRAGLGFRRLDRVLLTHRHLDHVLGLGGLIATLGLLRAGGALRIHGGRATLDFVLRYLKALWPEGGAPIDIELIALEPGMVIQEKDFAVRCFPVSHRDVESFGFRFEVPARRHLLPDRLAALSVPDGKLRAALARGERVTLGDGRTIEAAAVLGPPEPGASLVVIGDVDETLSLVEKVRGADALVIEATFLEEDAAIAAAYGHLTAAEAGRLAADAEIGMLYLTHLSGRYDGDAVLAEARRYFPRVRLAVDFAKWRVPEHGRAERRPRAP
ncbi:MAG TPA: MBL fold metallo-hydrolase [Stellaceae bacterium]